ncbi:MAG: type II secretion system GspH family protein [Oligoflexia bacterium]|nr:type II secretion system GspH family protein [Oligoflexia bacterium]
MKNQRGFTLVGAVVSAGLMTLFAMGTMSFQLNTKKEIQKQENLALRNSEYSQFYRLLSQPSYVGALAGIEANVALSECIRTDGKECTQGQDYPLTPIDLTTGQPIQALDPSAGSAVTSQLSFQVHCPLNAATCDAADYLIIKIKTSTKTLDGKAFETEKILSVKPKASNTVNFVPNTSLEPGRPANMILFLDGSGSMVFVKDSIKAALSALLNTVATMDVNFAIYDILQGTQKSQTQRYVIDPVTGARQPPPSPEAVGTVSYVDSNYSWGFGYVFPPPPSGPVMAWGAVRRISFSSQDSASQRAEKLAVLNAAIENIYSSGLNANPNYDDSSLCGMLRILNASSVPFDFDITTPNILMVIANENDESVLHPVMSEATRSKLFAYWGSQCVDNYSDKYTAYNITDQWIVRGSILNPHITVSSTFIIDGAPLAATKSFYNFTLPHAPGAAAGLTGLNGDCLAAATGPTLKPYIEQFLKSQTWVEGSAYTITRCMDYRQNLGTSFGSYSVPAPSGSYCDTGEETRLLNPSYIPGSCTIDYIASQIGYLVETGAIKYLVPEDTVAHQTNDLPLALVNTIKRKFDPNSTYFLPIIMPSTGECPLSTGSSYGTAFESVVAKLGTNASVTPLCGGDFTSKLRQISTFLTSLGTNDLTLSPAVVQNMTGLEIVRGTTTLLPTLGKEYTIQGNVLIFIPNYLLPTDKVRIYVK